MQPSKYRHYPEKLNSAIYIVELRIHIHTLASRSGRLKKYEKSKQHH